MKLRNKKTGEVGELYYEPHKKYHFTVATDDPADMTIHKTLAELNEEWEDYKPSEPLIKDEKIRKAVRAWAEANGIVYARKCGSLNAYTRRLVGFDALATSYTIEFEKHLKLYGDPDKIEKDSYTIAELCGEEEE